MKIIAKTFLYKTIVHILLIVVLGLLGYSNTFHVPFHFDDMRNISENPKLENLSNFWPPSGSRWVGFLTFALNYQLGGLDTFGYHIFNIFIHIINAILVYYLVAITFRTPYFSKIAQSPQNVIVRNKTSHLSLRGTESRSNLVGSGQAPQSLDFGIASPSARNDNSGYSKYIALFSALLFVSHPIQTQAVTYIVQRFTSLATFFYLLSLVMYVKARLEVEAKAKVKKNSIFSASTLTFYLLSLFSAILAMKTKEISFTLPFIIIIYEFCFFSKSPDSDPESSSGRTPNLKRFLFLLPFLLTLLIIPLSMIGIDKPIGDVIGELRETAQETEEIQRWGYLFTQFRVIVTYIRLLFLPINQNLDYDYPIYHSFFASNVILSFLFLLLIFGLGVYLLYRSRFTVYSLRFIAFGIFWFFITLSIESSIIPIRDVIFEHRLYLPSIGAFIAINTFLFIVVEKLKHRWKKIEKRVIVVIAVIIFLLTGTTCARNAVWEDAVSLWEDAVSKSPKKARANYDLGFIYQSKGFIDKAIKQYQIAIKLNPNYVDAYNNLGNIYQSEGLIDRAIEQYQIAIKLNPYNSTPYNNLGTAYQTKGLIDRAIEQYQIAIRLRTDIPVAYYNLGGSYFSKGMIDKAIEQYQIAIRIRGEYPEAYCNLGVAYRSKGLIDKAIEQYQIAIRLKPDYPKAHYNLGVAYQSKGLIDKAKEHFRIAEDLVRKRAK